ncbi:MAG TPA: hypothetical protein VLM76_14135 [Patescibacteria group bacterium]|nr:hypothetical protein [Patescibacteria group bacterium]
MTATPAGDTDLATTPTPPRMKKETPPMDVNSADLLGELARDAALERSDFLSRSAEQLDRFLAANAARIGEIGGMTLIDDDPDYLSVAPDLTFRSRTRYQDEETGEWISETEVLESASELVELYNPSDIYAAFAEAAREAAGLEPEPTAADELMSVAGISPEEALAPRGEDAYAAAADDWAATQPAVADNAESAAHRLYDVALTFQERSQIAEARILEQFEAMVSGLAVHLGDVVIVDDGDERLTLTGAGRLVAEVVPEGAEGAWRKLATPEELVEFYDPTDVFGDVADAIAEAYPAVAPELDDEDDEGDEGDEEVDEGDEEVDEGDEDAEARDDEADRKP